MKLAIFDFDGTLFPDETVPVILKEYGRLGYSRRRQAKVFMQMMTLFASYKLKLDKTLNKEIFRRKATQVVLSLFEGMTESEVDRYFEEFSVCVMKSIDPEVVKELKRHQEEGYVTVLLSGGFQPLLRPVGRQLSFDHIIGTELVYESREENQGFLQPYAPIHIVTGDNKTLELDKNFEADDIDWKNSYAYADSVYDQTVLRRVGNPVAVNPDNGLLDICTQENWRIIKTKAGERLDKKALKSK